MRGRNESDEDRQRLWFEFLKGECLFFGFDCILPCVRPADAQRSESSGNVEKLDQFDQFFHVAVWN